MQRHDLHLGAMYVVLGAAVGTYGLHVGSMAARFVGYGITVAAVWYVSRAAVWLYSVGEANGWEPTDYSSFHFTGASLATLGALGALQYEMGVMWESLAGVLVMVGMTFASGGMYERYKRSKLA